MPGRDFYLKAYINELLILLENSNCLKAKSSRKRPKNNNLTLSDLINQPLNWITISTSRKVINLCHLLTVRSVVFFFWVLRVVAYAYLMILYRLTQSFIKCWNNWTSFRSFEIIMQVKVSNNYHMKFVCCVVLKQLKWKKYLSTPVFSILKLFWRLLFFSIKAKPFQVDNYK